MTEEKSKFSKHTAEKIRFLMQYVGVFLHYGAERTAPFKEFVENDQKRRAKNHEPFGWDIDEVSELDFALRNHIIPNTIKDLIEALTQTLCELHVGELQEAFYKYMSEEGDLRGVIDSIDSDLVVLAFEDSDFREKLNHIFEDISVDIAQALERELLQRIKSSTA